LIKNDRLLIVGTANLESQVYEIVWLDNSVDRSEDVEEPPNKMSSLIGAETFEREHDQGNVSLIFVVSDFILLFRKFFGA
jgi:hypothetical protein